MNTIEELRARVQELQTEIGELAELDEPTEEQTERLDAATDEFTETRGRLEAAEQRAERVEEIRGYALKPGHTEDGDGGRTAPVPGATTRNLHDFDEARSVSDSPRAFAAELNSRAQSIIEAKRDMGHDHKGGAVALLEQGVEADFSGHAVADFWVRYGSPEYVDNWHRALRGDAVAQSMCRNAMPQEERASWAETTTTTGGFAVPPEYDLTLNLITTGAVNPFRQISRVRQTSSYQWYGLATVGLSAEWMTEGSEVSAVTPAFTQPAVTIFKADAYLTASFEAVADSNLGAEVMMLIADAKNRLEATAHAVGTGGGQPYGVITRVAAVTAARVAGSSGAAGAADLVAADVFAVDNALDPYWRQNGSWVANKVLYNKIRTLTNVGSGTAPASFWVDFGGGIPAQLIGYPTYESSAMDSTIVSGSNDDVLILGDFRSGYNIIDRIGMTMAFNPMVLGSNRRPTGQVGWLVYWRTGADVVDPTNAAHFKLLRL